jgi:hypothetical protein
MFLLSIRGFGSQDRFPAFGGGCDLKLFRGRSTFGCSDMHANRSCLRLPATGRGAICIQNTACYASRYARSVDNEPLLRCYGSDRDSRSGRLWFPRSYVTAFRDISGNVRPEAERRAGLVVAGSVRRLQWWSVGNDPASIHRAAWRRRNRLVAASSSDFSQKEADAALVRQ